MCRATRRGAKSSLLSTRRYPEQVQVSRPTCIQPSPAAGCSCAPSVSESASATTCWAVARFLGEAASSSSSFPPVAPGAASTASLRKFSTLLHEVSLLPHGDLAVMIQPNLCLPRHVRRRGFQTSNQPCAVIVKACHLGRFSQFSTFACCSIRFHPAIVRPRSMLPAACTVRTVRLLVTATRTVAPPPPWESSGVAAAGAAGSDDCLGGGEAITGVEEHLRVSMKAGEEREG
mmetsp:Transcript_1004/g.3151  ORF Transcript_1004/g.3151 Transcript_1004/m.3151 type:complete len:232 (-) Transcript_1004:14-709(-)